MTVHLHAQAQNQGEEALKQLMDGADEGDCACETCVVREVLTAAYPTMLEIARLELTGGGVPHHFEGAEH